MQGFKQPSVMSAQHSFAKTPAANIARSNFKRSRAWKGTFEPDYLVPVFIDEVLPGDTYSVRTNSVCRMSTLLYPLMDNLYLDMFYFFVPCRLLWSDWEHFCGAQDDPGDSTDFGIPQISFAGDAVAVGELADYFGLPEGFDETVSALPFRAYNLIYREWFRDENLIDSPVVDTDAGPDDEDDYVLRKRAKRYDYFTSLLPWPQKGDAIDLPLGTTAPVITGANQTWDSGNTIPLRGWDAASGALPAGNREMCIAGTNGNLYWDSAVGGTAAASMQPMNLWADLSSATAATINSLREAFQLQIMLERDARGGTRYVEILQSHFGVTSPDFRLQRPEYLGGGSQPIQVQPVAQQSESSGTPQGTLAGVGYQAGGLGSFSKSFVEHGYIIGLANVRADLTYQQGVHKLWTRFTRFDFYWPALAHLGEQEVLSREIYWDGTANDDDILGYQERWGEYRYAQSLITGALRSSYATSLDAWHLSQDFAARPVLNQSFIESAVPVDRVVATPSEPTFVGDFWHEVSCTRPLPTYSVPGLIDHF